MTEPRTGAGLALLSFWEHIEEDALRDAILAIEREAIEQALGVAAREMHDLNQQWASDMYGGSRKFGGFTEWNGEFLDELWGLLR